MRSNISGARLDNNLLMEKNKFGVMEQTITGTFVIDDDMPPIIGLSAAAPQDVTLPAVTKGLWFFVAATGASTLTVKNAGGSTIGSVAAASISYFVSDGTSWFCWTSGILSATDLTLTGNLTVGGNTDIGNAVTDTVGFYGSTKVAQGASASQAAVTLTAVTAIATAAPTKTTTTYGYKTSTQAAAIVARLNQVETDLGNLNVLLTAIRKALIPTSGVGLIKGGA